MKKFLQKNKGITLVALVITIIILLILAGITINSLTGSGLFGKAQLAKEKSEEAGAKENLTLSEYEGMINGYIDGSRDTVTIDKESYNKIITDLNSLKNEVEQMKNEFSSQAKVQTGTYVGTGTYGSSNKNTITFTKAPQIVFVMPTNGSLNQGKYANSFYFMQGANISSVGSWGSSVDETEAGFTMSCVCNWTNEGKTLEWYNNFNSQNQMNYKEATYKWVAIYE